MTWLDRLIRLLLDYRDRDRPVVWTPKGLRIVPRTLKTRWTPPPKERRTHG